MIYQLKISLKGVKPPIWRRVLVDSRITFCQLHQVIQVAMAWEEAHLHVFKCSRVPEGKLKEMERWEEPGGLFPFIGREERVAQIGDPVMLEEPVFDEEKEILRDWLSEEKDTIRYIYDFGDDWVHDILLEKILPPEPGVAYPVCIKARKPAPEEDSGGIWNWEVQGDVPSDAELLEEVNAGLKELREVWRDQGLLPEESALPADGGSERSAASTVDTEDVWRELYEAAVEFRELKPWTWMTDNQLFAVYDVTSGHTGYCSVMGDLGEVFGLAVYVDGEGLASLFRLFEEEIEDEDLLFEQRSLLLTFEDRRDLDARDVTQIKRLGLTFRGRKKWPLFRDYTPGFFPWYLDGEEAAFFARVLDQAVEVCRRVREDPSILETGEGCLFARISSIEGGRPLWEDGEVPFEPPPPPGEEPLHVDEPTLKQLRKRFKTAPVAVDFDYFYFPDVVQERKDERPYFPYVPLWMDQRTGLLFPFDLVKPDEKVEQFQRQLVKLIETLGAIPKTVRVRREDVRAILSPLAAKLGIRLRRVTRLPLLHEVRREMEKQLVGGRF